MSETKVPTITLIKHKEFVSKQSVYDHVPKLPMRAMILAPSGSGEQLA